MNKAALILGVVALGLVLWVAISLVFPLPTDEDGES